MHIYWTHPSCDDHRSFIYSYTHIYFRLRRLRFVGLAISCCVLRDGIACSRPLSARIHTISINSIQFRGSRSYPSESILDISYKVLRSISCSSTIIQIFPLGGQANGVTRKYFPNMKLFVAFSSVSCGKGNASRAKIYPRRGRPWVPGGGGDLWGLPNRIRIPVGYKRSWFKRYDNAFWMSRRFGFGR